MYFITTIESLNAITKLSVTSTNCFYNSNGYFVVHVVITYSNEVTNRAIAYLIFFNLVVKTVMLIFIIFRVYIVV